MQLILQSSNLSEYLECSEVIDCINTEIQEISQNLAQSADNEIEMVRGVYVFVMDEINHSSDVGETRITYMSSDVLKYKHGLCFAKSHLLAAILRNLNVPTGFVIKYLNLIQETFCMD